MYVLTADQQGSRRRADRVPVALAALAGIPVVLPFERTVGDELQGLLRTADDAVEAALRLIRLGDWSVGLGVGPVRMPLPASTRTATGAAYVSAREALDQAKSRPDGVAACGPPPAGQAGAVLALLGHVLDGRSDAAWEAIDLVRGRRTMAAVAGELGISRQAVSQRLAVAGLRHEREVRPVVVRLLREADAARPTADAASSTTPAARPATEDPDRRPETGTSA